MTEANIEVANPLCFTDLYINLDNVGRSDVHYSGHPSRFDVGKTLTPYFNDLYKMVINKVDGGDISFSIKYDEKMFRCTLLNGVNGRVVSVRSQPMKMVDLRDISIPMAVKRYCTSARLNKGGLIIVSGSPGQGKTTTCAAVLIERLRRYGGFCLAIEDPAELPLDGLHGEGRCVQVEISNKMEYEDAGRVAMRCYPTDKQGILFISEVRDSEGATLALRAALDGRLVITTMHADGPISALKRMVSYASLTMNEAEANNLLGSGFRLCLHQTKDGPKVSAEILMDTDAVGQMIRNGKFDMLGSELEHQQLLMRGNKSIDIRSIS